MAVRVLLADDHTMFRQGMRRILSVKAKDSIEVVGEASNGKEACAKALTLNPDVVLMDVHMPEMDGFEATRHIREQGTEKQQPWIIALTTDIILNLILPRF